jgi:SAM-dependent methyltransferase
MPTATTLAGVAESTRASYDALAPFYDAFTAHHDYERWTAMLERLAHRHGLRGNRLLDVACGTGKSFAPFLDRGYEVTGCDLSPAMLAVARAKTPAVALHERDMRALGRLGSFDLVTCLDDALNHLLSEDDLERAFAGVRANLAPGGVFVFDLNTLACYRAFFARPLVVEHDGGTIVWQGRGDAAAESGCLAEATLDAFALAGGDRYRRVATLHRQRHHPRAVVEQALAAAGLECAGSYGQDLASNAEPRIDELRHSKAVYVALNSERG